MPSFEDKYRNMKLAKDDILYQISQFHGVCWKVGFCGEDAPRAVLPTAMATATADENREDEAAAVWRAQCHQQCHNICTKHRFFTYCIFFGLKLCQIASGILEMHILKLIHINEMNEQKLFTSYFSSTLQVFIFVYDCFTEIALVTNN